jgi:hypothetical protein
MSSNLFFHPHIQELRTVLEISTRFARISGFSFQVQFKPGSSPSPGLHIEEIWHISFPNGFKPHHIPQRFLTSSNTPPPIWLIQPKALEVPVRAILAALPSDQLRQTLKLETSQIISQLKQILRPANNDAVLDIQKQALTFWKSPHFLQTRHQAVLDAARSTLSDVLQAFGGFDSSLPSQLTGELVARHIMHS